MLIFIKTSCWVKTLKNNKTLNKIQAVAAAVGM